MAKRSAKMSWMKKNRVWARSRRAALVVLETVAGMAIVAGIAVGRSFSLAALSGRKVVVYFYPKDDTPGCTNEALDFSAAWAAFEAADTELVGVSADSAASHARCGQSAPAGRSGKWSVRCP